MIDNTSSLPGFNAIKTNLGAAKPVVKPKDETETSLPKETVTFGGLPEKPTAEDMRRADIRFAPLHFKKETEKTPDTNIDSNSNVTSDQDLENIKNIVLETGTAVQGASGVRGFNGAPAFISSDSLGIDFADMNKSFADATDLKDEGFDIGPFEQNLQKELGKLASIQNANDVTGIAGEIPDLKKLKETFNECANDKSIPWDFALDGCYARAHLAAKKFLDKGLACAKIFCFVGKPGQNPLESKHLFKTKAKYSHGKFWHKGNWWYHVAVLAFAKDEKGNTKAYVVDPAINLRKPMKPEDWVKSYWNGNFDISIDTTQADVYNPPESYQYNFPAIFSKQDFNSNLPDAEVSCKEYDKVLHIIKDNYYKRHPDEKPAD